MNRLAHPRLHLILLALSMWVLTALIGWVGTSRAGGTFVYPLDDTYIHLSIARTLAESGQWSLDGQHIAFASSSPLYDVLLVGLHLAHPSWVWPLVINLLAIWGIAWCWVGTHPMTSSSLLTGLAWMALLPLPLLALLGMEHSLHIVSALIWLKWFEREQSSNQALVWAGLISALMTGLRYESLFLLGGMILSGWHKERGKLMLASLLGGGTSILLFGGWSLAQGGTFLPLSLIGKGTAPWIDFSEWVGHGITQLYENPFMWACLLILGALISRLGLPGTSYSPFTRKAALLLFWATFAHLFFAEVGGYRYEAYLIGLTLWLGWKSLDHPRSLLPTSLQQGVLLAIALFPFVIRAMFFYWNTPTAMKNIYEQPYQAGEFLARYYAGKPVGVNDIGLSTYKGNISLTDMVGIGDQAVRRLRQNGQFTQESMSLLLRQRNVHIVIGHQPWIGPYIPTSMQEVARWTLPDNFICADPTLTFWATAGTEADSLRKRLEQFTPQLPPSLLISYPTPLAGSPD